MYFQVSWIRKRDSHILTVDRYTFIADERFQVLHNGDTWTLQIKYVQSRDAGVYECQVTTEPKMSQFVQLDVVVPQTKILGESELFVKSGSTVQIKCIITQSLEQPAYIFWYHDGGRVVSLNGKHQSVERVSLYFQKRIKINNQYFQLCWHRLQVRRSHFNFLHASH